MNTIANITGAQRMRRMKAAKIAKAAKSVEPSVDTSPTKSLLQMNKSELTKEAARLGIVIDQTETKASMRDIIESLDEDTDEVAEDGASDDDASKGITEGADDPEAVTIDPDGSEDLNNDVIE